MKRTVTLADVRIALKRSPSPRQFDEMLPLVFLCEELVARPLLRTSRPMVDVEALDSDDIDALIEARDAHTITDSPRAIREALVRIAAKQRETP